MNKIAIVINSINGGGAEGAMFNLYKSFLEREIETILITVNCNIRCNHNFNYICLGRKRNRKLIGVIPAYFRLKKLLNDCDKVIINCELPELISTLIPVKNSQFYIVEHTTKPWAKRKPLGLFVRLVLKIKNANWIKVNDDKKTIWPFSEEFTYIPNIVENTNTNWDYSPENITNLVFIGRLAHGKNPDLVCKVANDLHLKLDIYGEGPLRKTLMQHYGGSSNIVFHGFIPKVWDLISQNSLIIVPSDYEGDGLVVVESLIRRNPILLSDNQDLRRFNLPDAFYFIDENNLRLKLLRVINSGSTAEFRPNIEISNYYKFERSPENVSNKWLSTLGIRR